MNTHNTAPKPWSQPQAGLFRRVLDWNIRALQKRQAEQEAKVGRQERLASHVTAFTGSMLFVFIHLVVFGLWVLINAGVLPFVPKWDENFIILGTSASIEAIFLSTFILISQNRMAQVESRRAELDLQVNLLAEHEVTRLMALVSAIAEKLEVKTEVDREEVEELKQEIEPARVLEQLDSAKALSSRPQGTKLGGHG